MPTPYGSRGGLAFGAEELSVLRRALALAVHPRTASPEDVKDCLRLAESVDEALREGARLRAFLLADLARYRAALPGAATGYLALLGDALRAGYRPVPDDLAALRALRDTRGAGALLDHCRRAPADSGGRARPTARRAAIPASRTRLTVFPGGLASGEEPTEKPARKPADKPADKPAEGPGRQPAPRPGPRSPRPSRPIPTPGEVFPPKRKPGPPQAQRQLAVG
ncbi:hypothetical protein [Streptomyces nodosus]|uniref:hypothetical protein n=1 Tax=Streptomyces nodosus TaxID=40318 RepID=UPI003815ECC6